MFEWLGQNYSERIKSHLQDAIDYGDMTEMEAQLIYEVMMQKWMDGYGDYCYDVKGDR